MSRFVQKRTQDSLPSIRAAAHNPHAAGIAMPAVRMGAGGPVIQRMIREDFFRLPLFEAIGDMPTLHRFISMGVLGKEFYFVNNRAQTFKQAVNEFIKTQSPKYRGVQEEWQKLLATGELRMAKYHMGKIVEIINSVKSEYPDHPNAFWPGHEEAPELGPQHEARGTIPQTPESRKIANALWELLDAEDAKLKKAVLEGTKGFEGSAKENFMLGVLVFPNKHVIVSVSGHIEALSVLEGICRKYVEGNGFFLDGVFDTKGLSAEAGLHYAQSFKHVTGRDASTFSKEKGDLGNKPGTCAAAVALGIKEALRPGRFEDRQPGAVGKVRLGLTEVFTGRSVVLSNRLVEGSQQHWPKEGLPAEYDIPSCETCQHQLPIPALELVKLDRIQRLERYYPEQKKLLPEQIRGLEKALKIELGKKETSDAQLDAATKAAKTKKQALEAFQGGKEKELSELRASLRKTEEELAAAKSTQALKEATDNQALEYCKKYLNAKEPQNSNSYDGKSAGYWWDEFAKRAPGMEKVDRGAREAKATAFKNSAESSKKPESSGSGPVIVDPEIARLNKQIGLIEKKIAEMGVESKEAAQEKVRQKEENSNLGKRVESLQANILALQSKLARSDDKMRREKAALNLLMS